MLCYRHLLTLCIGLFLLSNASAQRGLIVTSASSNVMDPNGDGYVSLTNSGFSNDGYYVDEFELPMFGLPVFGDGDALGDTQAGPNCGTTDLTVDSNGFSAYAVLDDDNNLIFRLRLADEHPSVEAYTILIDTDGNLGPSDPNYNGINAGFEIDITLIKSNSKGINVYDIDGLASCPTPVLQYDLADNFQLSIADIVSCGDEDYFYDFYVPFGDLTDQFGITVDSELQFIVVTNISGTCAMAGKISDIGGVDDDEYAGCITCAFEDLASNQCPVPFSNLCSTCEGFLSGATPTPTMEIPLKEGDAVISGTAEAPAELTVNIFDLNDNLLSEETAITDADGNWSMTLAAPLVQGDSVTAVAQIAGSCDSGVTGSQLSFAVVVLNTTPTINGTGTDLGYTENDGLIPVDDAIDLLDNEDLDLAGATVSIIGGFVSTEDALSFTDQNGITGSYNTTTGVLTLTGDATLTEYITAVQSVSYVNSSEDPDESPRTIEVIINDGTEDSDPFTRVINVVSVNDPPVLTGTTGSTEYTTETPPFVVNNTMSITDLDHTQIAAASIQVVESATDLFVPGDDLVFTNQLGITGSYDNATGILTLSGSASNTDYATAINSITYEYSPPGTANEETRRIDFTVADGSDNSNTFSHFITFATSTNFPPEVVDESNNPTDNIATTVQEDGTIEICVNVNDPDGDLVSLNSVTGEVNGTVTTTSSLCFEYTPDANFNGTETIEITVCDALGNCDDPVTVDIDITAVNDVPVLNALSVDVNEKETTEICVTATDIEGDTHEFSSGTSTNGGTAASGVTGGLCFDYTPPTNFVGMDQVEVTICDAADPSVCTTGTVNVNVLSVNETPIILVNGIESVTMDVIVTEDIPMDFCFEVIDFDGDNVTTTSITNNSGGGTLVENATEFCFNYTPDTNQR